VPTVPVCFGAGAGVRKGPAGVRKVPGAGVRKGRVPEVRGAGCWVAGWLGVRSCRGAGGWVGGGWWSDYAIEMTRGVAGGSTATFSSAESGLPVTTGRTLAIRMSNLVKR
jgi:hypothetical protein